MPCAVVHRKHAVERALREAAHRHVVRRRELHKAAHQLVVARGARHVQRLEPLAQHMVQHGAPQPDEAGKALLPRVAPPDRAHKDDRLRQAVHLVRMRAVRQQVEAQRAHDLLHCVHVVARERRDDRGRALQRGADPLPQRLHLVVPRVARRQRRAGRHVERRGHLRDGHLAEVCVNGGGPWLCAPCIVGQRRLACERLPHPQQVAAHVVVPGVVVRRLVQTRVEHVQRGRDDLPQDAQRQADLRVGRHMPRYLDLAERVQAPKAAVGVRTTGAGLPLVGVQAALLGHVHARERVQHALQQLGAQHVAALGAARARQALHRCDELVRVREQRGPCKDHSAAQQANVPVQRRVGRPRQTRARRPHGRRTVLELLRHARAGQRHDARKDACRVCACKAPDQRAHGLDGVRRHGRARVLEHEVEAPHVRVLAERTAEHIARGDQEVEHHLLVLLADLAALALLGQGGEELQHALQKLGRPRIELGGREPRRIVLGAARRGGLVVHGDTRRAPGHLLVAGCAAVAHTGRHGDTEDQHTRAHRLHRVVHVDAGQAQVQERRQVLGARRVHGGRQEHLGRGRERRHHCARALRRLQLLERRVAAVQYSRQDERRLQECHALQARLRRERREGVLGEHAQQRDGAQRAHKLALDRGREAPCWRRAAVAACFGTHAARELPGEMLHEVHELRLPRAPV